MLGDSLQSSEETSKILNCPFPCHNNYFYYYYYYKTCKLSVVGKDSSALNFDKHEITCISLFYLLIETTDGGQETRVPRQKSWTASSRKMPHTTAQKVLRLLISTRLVSLYSVLVTAVCET